MDSLKPVLALRLKDSTGKDYTVQMSAAADESDKTPMATMVKDEDGNYSPAAQPYRPANPAYGASHPAYPVSDGLMAEEVSASVNSWVLAAAAAAVAGIAMLALSKRKGAAVVEV